MHRPSFTPLLALVTSCISIPDRYVDPDGMPVDARSDATGDGAPSGCTPVNGAPTSVFAFANMVTATDGETMVTFDPPVRDNTCSFDGARFTAPTRGDYLICASTSSSNTGAFGLSIEGAVQRRLGYGAGTASGCVGVTLLENATLALVADAQPAGTRLAEHRPASWISIDAVQTNGGVTGSAYAAGIEGTLAANDPIRMTGSAPWNGSGMSTDTSSSYLACASLAFTGTSAMRLRIGGALVLMDSPTGGATTGCQRFTAAGAETVSLTNAAGGPGTSMGPAARNWISVQRLANQGWHGDARGTAGATIGAGVLGVVELMSSSFVNGQWNNSAFTPSAGGGGESLVCVQLVVPAAMAIEVVRGNETIELTRGEGRLHGCGIIGTGGAESFAVRVRNLTSSDQTIAPDPDARVDIHKIH